jgi:uncharacterized protein (DUF952 family)
MARMNPPPSGERRYMTSLFRITALADWQRAQASGVVPRCAADERDGCIPINAEDDIERVASAFFSVEAQPLALELDATALGESITWLPAAPAKPWPQGRLAIPNILCAHVLSVRPRLPAASDAAHARRLPSRSGD